MKKLVVFIICKIFIVLCCNAQSVVYKGVVLDSITQKPIEFANVILMNVDSSFVVGSVTDSLGSFVLASSDIKQKTNYIVQITHVCYERKVITYNQSKPVSILKVELSPNEIMMDNVIVKAIRTKVRNRINFNYEFTDAMKEGVRLTSNLLEKVPTVFLDYDNNVYIKGSSNILIMKNGVRLSDNSLVDQIQPSSVINVEIMYNVPSKYAGQNYSAVMNIITKKEQGYSVMVDNKTAVDGSIIKGKVNLGLETEQASYYLFYKLNRLNLEEKNDYITYNTTDELITTESLITDPLRRLDNEIFFGLSYQMNDKLQLGADGYVSLYREHFDNRYNNASKMPYSLQKEKYNVQHYKLYVDHKGDNEHFLSEITYDKYSIRDRDAYFEKLLSYEQNEDNSTLQAKIDFEKNFNEFANLYLGVKYLYSHNSYIFNNYYSDMLGIYDLSDFFAYSEFMMSIGEHWMIDLGLSVRNYQRIFDSNDKVKMTEVFPKFNSSYSWNNNHNLSLGYSSYLDEPTVWSLLPFVKRSSSNLVSMGNTYLKPEKHGTLMFEYSYSYQNFYFATSTYFKHINNYIVDDFRIEKDVVMEKTNIRKNRNYGVDVTLSCDLTKWWSLSLYGDMMYRCISANEYYDKTKFSFMTQVQSVWTIIPSLYFILQYTHNSENLEYNGYSKLSDSSVGMLNYTINDYLDIYAVCNCPLGNTNSYSKIYNQSGAVEMNDDLTCRKFMLCLTFTLSKGKKQRELELFENKSKKY